MNQPQIKPNPTTSETLKDAKNTEQVLDDRQVQRQQAKVIKPEYVFSPDYKDVSAIVQAMPHLKSIQENQDLDTNALGDSYSFIIRSNNDDDVHKSIKYGVWSSTPGNNEKLSEVWKKAQEEKKDIYLFFSVVKSGQFVGVAKMTCDLQEETFAFWWQSHKWKHHFSVEWLFVKDITYKFFGNLINSKDDPVIRSKDGTEVDWEKTGKVMLEIFQKAPPQQTIFNDFEFMDTREQGLRQQRNNTNNQYMSNNYSYNNQQKYYNNSYGNYNQGYMNNMYYNMMPMQMPFNVYPMQYGRQQFLNQKFNNIYPPSSPPKYNNNYQQPNQNLTQPQQ